MIDVLQKRCRTGKGALAVIDIPAKVYAVWNVPFYCRFENGRCCVANEDQIIAFLLGNTNAIEVIDMNGERFVKLADDKAVTGS